MASVRKEILIDADPDDAWNALRDWGALHTRLAPGFITDLRLDEGDRIITVLHGTPVRERLVTRDEDGHRLVWTIVGGPYTHHNGWAQVSADGANGLTRFTWVTDFLPDELAARTTELMDHGIAAIKRTLEA